MRRRGDDAPAALHRFAGRAHRALRSVDAPATALARDAVDRAGLAPFDAAAVALGPEHPDDVERGLVAEELARLLLVPADAVALDQRDEVAGAVAGERRAAVVRVLRQVVRGARAAVREVAAAAARDADLFADAVAVLDQQLAPPPLRRGRRAHHAGGAGADHDGVAVRAQGAADRSDPGEAVARNGATASRRIPSACRRRSSASGCARPGPAG